MTNNTPTSGAMRRSLRKLGVRPRWWWTRGRLWAEWRARVSDSLSVAVCGRMRNVVIGVAGEDLEPGDMVAVDFGLGASQVLRKVNGDPPKRCPTVSFSRAPEDYAQVDGLELGDTVELDPVALGLMTQEEFDAEPKGPHGVYKVTRVGRTGEPWELTADEGGDEE